MALVTVGETPIVSNKGTITKPPPIPTIEANVPAIMEFYTSYLAISGVILKSFCLN